MGTGFDESIGGRPVDVVHRQFEAVPQETAGELRADMAEADKSDSHFQFPPAALVVAGTLERMPRCGAVLVRIGRYGRLGPDGKRLSEDFGRTVTVALVIAA